MLETLIIQLLVSIMFLSRSLFRTWTIRLMITIKLSMQYIEFCISRV